MTFLTIFIFASILIGYLSTTGTKSQWIRILDIVVIGPLMIYMGSLQDSQSISSALLIYFGATTIGYNLHNYMSQRKKMDKDELKK
jgi:hypothetical protein